MQLLSLGVLQSLQGCRECRAPKGSLTCRAAAPVAPTQRSMLGRVQGLKPRQQRSSAAQLAHFINYAAQLRKPCPWKEMSEVIKYAFSGEMMQVVNENVTWDVNMCGDVKTSLSVFEFVQEEAEVTFCECSGNLSEPSVVTKKWVSRVSLFVINFISAMAQQMLGLWCKGAFGAGQLLMSSEQCTRQCPPANTNSWAGLGCSKTWVIIPEFCSGKTS